MTSDTVGKEVTITAFVGALSTLATYYVNQKIKIGITEGAAINTMITIIGSSLLIKGPQYLSGFSPSEILSNYWLIVLLFSVVILFYSQRERLRVRMIGFYAKFYTSADVTGQNIERFVKYIGNFKDFYIFSNFILDDVTVSYDKIRSPIAFYDRNYHVSGVLTFSEQVKETKNGDKTETETQTILRLTDCSCRNTKVCKNILDYVQNVLMYKFETGIRNNETKLTGNNFIMYTKYINMNKDFYYDEQNLISLDDEVKVNIFFEANKTFKFYDTRFNVSGFISWKDKTISMRNCQMSQAYSFKEYLIDVSKFLNEATTNANKIILYKVERTRGGGKSYVMYNGPVLSQVELEQTYIHTLFHPEMRSLWEHIKTINYEPDKIRALGQAPRINLLLYGPPGTGKSTFAYRVAMATKRHIMNIKLSAVKKDELLTLFSTPKIETQECKPKDIVYVLDEIDVEIDKMMFKQKRQEEQCKMTKETITKLIDSTLSDKNRGCQQQGNAPVIVVGNDDKKQMSPSQPPDSQVKSALEMINNLEKVIDSMTKAYDKIGGLEGEMVTLADLLTVFQGAVPIEGCIIVAMTNRYEELTQLCPALFRAGRLSPVQFEHFDMKMLSDVVKMYFGQEIKYETNHQLEIPPSEIMEIITPAMIQHHTYDQFIVKLKEKVAGIIE